MKYWLPVLMLGLIALVGCGEDKPEEEVKEPPPPPTAAEVAAEVRGPLQQMAQAISAGQVAPPAAMQQTRQQVQEAVSKHKNPQSSPNGAAGLTQAGDFVEEMLVEANEKKLYTMVLFSYNVLGDVDASAQPNYERFARRAFLQANRPQIVDVTSIIIDHNTDTRQAIMTLRFPHTGEAEKVNMVPGDCWSRATDHPLAGDTVFEICLVEVVSNTLLRFEYTPTGEIFEFSK